MQDMSDKRSEFMTLVQTILAQSTLLKMVFPTSLEHDKSFAEIILENAESLHRIILYALQYENTYEDFVILLSYEIRTPLTPIEETSRLILMMHDQQLDERQLETLRVIQQTAIDLLKLFKDEYRNIRARGDNRGN
jgi:signal transduction histidine kinase